MKNFIIAITFLFAAALTGCATPLSIEGLFHPTTSKVVIEDFEPAMQTEVDAKTGQLVRTPVPDTCDEFERITDDKGNIKAGEKCLKWLIAGKRRTITTEGVGAQDAAQLARTENEHEGVHAYGALGAYGRGACSDPIDCALLNAGAVAPTVLVPGTTGTTAPADGKKVDELAKSVDKQGKALRVFGEVLDEHVAEEEKK